MMSTTKAHNDASGQPNDDDNSSHNSNPLADLELPASYDVATKEDGSPVLLQPRDKLIWFYFGDGYWYAAIQSFCGVIFIDSVIGKNHLDKALWDRVKGDAEKHMLFTIVQRRHAPYNYGLYHLMSSFCHIESNYNKFLYERVQETHRFHQVKKRGQCSHCKARVYNQCKAPGCGKFSCIKYPQCLQHHWQHIVNAYDYRIHKLLPHKDITDEAVSLE